MAETPRGIWYPDPSGTDQMAPLQQRFRQLAESTDAALGGVLELPARWMSKTGGMVIAHNSWTTIGGWTPDPGSPGAASGITYDAGRFIVSQPGIYRVFLKFAFAATTSHRTGYRGIRLGRNGTNDIISISGMAPTDTNSGVMGMECECPRIQLAAGDFVQAQANQQTGSGLAPSASNGTQLFMIEMIRPL